MNTGFPILETIKTRRSVRSYETKEIPQDLMEKINTYMQNLSNPFQVDVKFQLLETQDMENVKKLGTYGVIKGAKNYIGVTVKNVEYAMEAVGYSFEMLILYAASLGLGTCWLGGTFKRSEFANAMKVQEDELFPAISPIGLPLGKKTFTESLVRKLAKADQRKEWDLLFFQDDFSKPLKKIDAGTYELPLEMVRIAPSASNKQPWRIVKTEEGFHFYKEKGYGDWISYDIQKVDIGIAACHFQITAEEEGLTGKFANKQPKAIVPPANTEYILSWLFENETQY